MIDNLNNVLYPLAGAFIFALSIPLLKGKDPNWFIIVYKKDNENYHKVVAKEEMQIYNNQYKESLKILYSSEDQLSCLVKEVKLFKCNG